MKKHILLGIAISILAGCTTNKLPSVSDEMRSEISWNAFCDARGYDRNDNTYLTVNEYLNTWCGSVDEENAFCKAGVEAY